MTDDLWDDLMEIRKSTPISHKIRIRRAEAPKKQAALKKKDTDHQSDFDENLPVLQYEQQSSYGEPQPKCRKQIRILVINKVCVLMRTPLVG